MHVWREWRGIMWRVKNYAMWFEREVVEGVIANAVKGIVQSTRKGKERGGRGRCMECGVVVLNNLKCI
ncbi:predicted protein [Sclerotinia sclerotiorum 1980 UF-70]|uniref:Uncharacterized protein n=1 Tax=Sclerotinia sclerotiorum (strain ATCC 18683 / 1980 / Ss-1) TaxID=665079 RepID=A7E6J0_SCLS1|nr:predicted protein [Sclerotinia sclerotiorum 1980 UF-70]EDN91512.1 predicted protein [Sclerotinia sclerotiorum 1980 UF-70]